MKIIVNLLVQIFLVCALLISISCASKSESSKEVAEDLNEGKFETKSAEQDAQFLVNAVDDSFTILNLANLAREKGSMGTAQKAGEIKEDQTKVLDQLKAYAAGQVISIPQSGPEEIRDSQKNLYDESEKFDEKWCQEIINENQKMIQEFEEYSEKAEGNLKIVIAEVLPTLRSQHDKLQSYKTAVNN